MSLFGAIDPINREVIQDEFAKMQSADLQDDDLRQPRHRRGGEDGRRALPSSSAGRLVQYDTPDNILAHPTEQLRLPISSGGDRTLKRLRLIAVREAMTVNPPSRGGGR